MILLLFWCGYCDKSVTVICVSTIDVLVLGRCRRGFLNLILLNLFLCTVSLFSVEETRCLGL